MKKVFIWIQNLVDSTMGKAIVSVADKALDSKLEAILQDLHDSNIDDYKATVAGLNAAFKKLQPLAAKTETTIDDAILEDWQELIIVSAAKNGISL